MSSNFFRLYRQISDESSGKISNADELSHEFERRETLHRIGYKVGIKDPKLLERNKYHGKLAREKEKLKQISAIPDYKQWKLNYSMQLREINHLNAAATEMKDVLLNNDKVTISLWNKFNVNAGESGNSSPLVLNRVRNKSVASSKRISHIESSNSLARDIEKENTLKSHLLTPNRLWTEKEKKKINDLFWEISKPKTKSPVAWDIYYQMFVGRFLESFPNRNFNEVRLKIQSMLRLRQLKLKGENEYWDELRSKSDAAIKLS